MDRLNEFLYHLISARAGQNILWDDVAVFLADFLLYFLVLGAILLFAMERNWKKRWFLFLEAGLSAILARGIITELFYRFYIHARPYDFYGVKPLVVSLGNSFPSGHMAFLWAIAGVIFFHSRRWGWWYFLAGTLMGVARVFAGVHWPLDILGGILIGLLSALFIHGLLAKAWADPSIPKSQLTADSEPRG